LLHKFWGSFSSSCLVTWAAQVAGGDEPPSVLSDNLPKVWLIEPDLFASAGSDAWPVEANASAIRCRRLLTATKVTN
jgi:hypothetical protein